MSLDAKMVVWYREQATNGVGIDAGLRAMYKWLAFDLAQKLIAGT
jgi:hypothetical protein